MRKQLIASILLPLFAASAFAAEPASGVLSPDSGPLVYTIAPFLSGNPTPVPLVDLGPTCDEPAPECDSFLLTVSLPAGYAAAHNSDTIKVKLEWSALSGQADYDMYIYQGEVGATDGGDNPPNRSASGANPEVATIFPLVDGENQYTIKVVPYVPGGETLTVTVALDTAAATDLDPNFGQADSAVPGAPRYQNFSPSPGIPGEAGNGEYNIGYNELSGKIMAMAFGNGSVFRVTPAESLDQPLPASCQALWEDATPIATSGPQPVADPILYTDRVSGRTWASNLTAGPNVSYAFTDNDGLFWTEAGAGGLAGADHQTIGSGPYPADSIIPHPLHENAVYFCSQALVGPAGCVRSDDGGLTYGVTTLAYDGSVCSGLHGHVRVAPNGTVWLPVEECGTGTGAAVSLDAGVTWTDFMVPTTADQGASGSDPSVAIDADSTAYFCYSNGDGHIRAAVSHDNGATWEKDRDLGLAHGIVNSAFPEAWGGDSGRAACAFLGTNQPGDLQSIDFPGLWYGFVAHTYDGGETWTTVNVTPNDPVQGIGGIWQGGGSNPNRNLLDFNEITADGKGRVLFGYDDGCVRDCAKDPKANPQSFTAMMKIARQTGGKSLYAAEDLPEPRAPAEPCLDGERSSAGAMLNWVTPDHGGADISNYKVYRSQGLSLPYEFVGDAGSKTQFVDASADPNVSTYFYTVTAINSAGEGLKSNPIELPISTVVPESLCVLPGVTLFTDSAGDWDTALAAPGLDQNDLLHGLMAQPDVTDGVTRLVFTLRLASLATPLPPSAAWFVTFESPDGGLYGVRMETDAAGLVRFFSYTVGESSGGITDGRFVGEEGPIEAETSYDADGAITFVVKATDVGGTGAAGEEYKNFNSGAVQLIGAAGTGAADVVDAMPDGLARAGRVVLIANGQCADGSAPPAPPVNPTVPTTPDVPSVDPSTRRGGALGGVMLLALLGLGLTRRRKRI